MSAFEMYLIMKLDIISEFILIFSSISISICFFITVALLIENEIKNAIILTIFIIVSLCILFIGMLIPTTKQATILYIAPKVINSDFVKEGLSKEAKEMYGLFKEYIKEEVKEK